MKKFLSLVLALTLCMTASLALARTVNIPETAGSFDLSITVPEGYTMTDSSLINELSVSIFEPSDPEKMPEISLAIAYSEEYADMSLTKDMDDEQIKELYGVIDDGYQSESYVTGVTDDGWKYLQVMDNEADNGYTTLIMIHDGYFIEVFVNYADFRPMTEDDLTAAKALLDSFVITDVK